MGTWDVDRMDELAEKLGKLLLEVGWTLGVAESCTGGLLGHSLTNIPGSSDYFKGGIVAYANEIKRRLLQVEESTLEKYGAVSRETALQMARGARAALSVDIAASITGIAGPDGGTADKPVGTVWIAVSHPGGEQARLYQMDGDRLQVKQQSARTALEMLIGVIEDMA
jgi:nicotinamide-nucleotide amidase